MSGGHFFLPWNASKARLREAENARKRRQEIVKSVSEGAVSRRELFKWGLITGAGLIAPIHGLSPFVTSAYADDGGGIPTGAPPSPGLAGLAFTQPLPRFEVLPRNPVSSLNPAPTIEANTTQTYTVDPLLGGGIGPVEGRPPGPDWGHQRWDEFLPQIAIEVTQEGAKTNPNGNIPFKFHPSLPVQGPNAMWTFNGTLPPKLILGRYGEPILFRHHNQLPADVKQNGGFGRHTLTTHFHNGHHGAENDGFTGAFFFPGQFYDNHYPLILAGHDTINVNGTDPRAGGPDDNGGINKIPGDWHETMSTHWFHDHMFTFTSHNVYKGIAGMANLYSAVDRGNESINDGINLQLPSGTANSWGNLDYDINLMLADKAWDQAGQLYFDIFNTDGFLGDVMTVNFAYKPYFEVEPRRYRFRILNGSVSRFFKLALSDSSPMVQIANDGNLLPHPVTQTQLDEQGIAERYDIVIDFSRYTPGQKVWMVNLCEHQNGAGPSRDLSVAQALGGKSSDPCVGEFLEFRVVLPLKGKDQSLDFGKANDTAITLIPNPDLSNIPVARQRTFAFKDGGTDSNPWSIRTDNGEDLDADFGRISAAPREGTREVWKLINDGGNWDHPIHIHFEEGRILSRSGGDGNSGGGVPAWEQGRKDVYRLHRDGTVTLTMQFREFAGMFMEHCHNTVHEDHAMLLRFEVGRGLVPLPTPSPTPQGVKFISTSVLKGAF
ncbi:MAG TPA: multicopper oxidase domain-containing protein [Candidatus Acidoferrales bacterium]|jgi:FtsP/CotA-like multicopper oxidase with cupredoxin domain|nr:multicopper oxidase domain-containing protein [Candidatus Acidoferrales bacterium]